MRGELRAKNDEVDFWRIAWDQYRQLPVNMNADGFIEVAKDAAGSNNREPKDQRDEREVYQDCAHAERRP
jgi:hypothetical protein